MRTYKKNIEVGLGSKYDAYFIPPVLFNPGVDINTAQLMAFFSLRPKPTNPEFLQSADSGPTVQGMPLGMTQRNYIFKISNNKITQFGSGTLCLGEVKTAFKQVPDDLQPLKCQLMNLIERLEIELRLRVDAQNKDDEVTEKLLKVIETKRPVSMQRADLKLRHPADLKETQNAFYVPEQCYQICDFSEGDVFLGTTEISACLGLIIYNPFSKKCGMAHLNGFTIANFGSSIDNMFSQCQGTADTPNQVFVVGWDHLRSPPNLQSRCGGGYASHTLAQSIYDFVEKRKDCTSTIKTHFSKDIVDTGCIMVHANADFCDVFTTPDEDMASLLKKEFNPASIKYFIEDPTYFHGLIDVSSIDPRRNLTASKEEVSVEEIVTRIITDSGIKMIGSARAKDISFEQIMEWINTPSCDKGLMQPGKLGLHIRRALIEKFQMDPEKLKPKIIGSQVGVNPEDIKNVVTHKILEERKAEESKIDLQNN